jgi:hypothetical protein
MVYAQKQEVEASKKDIKIFYEQWEKIKTTFICRSQLCIYSRPMDEVIRNLFQRKKENKTKFEKFVYISRKELVQCFLIFFSYTERKLFKRFLFNQLPTSRQIRLLTGVLKNWTGSHPRHLGHQVIQET